ncbi:MAG TPA: malonyl-[acyl-carrier protein] O-methyltransferase BioC [Halothiobacillaceae bacterium]|nr:malonyl-[acyl-carrier protein] O-methyltransferase BioC [Halothiobacillaceae bacterium]
MKQKTQYDRRCVRARFNRAAAEYDRFAHVQQEIGRRLEQRFDLIKLVPQRVLDLGAGTGQLALAMQKRYSKAEVVAIDLAESMLKHIPRRHLFARRPSLAVADMHALPFAGSSFDIVVSNFTLQWSDDLKGLFNEIARLLRPSGVVAFSTLGPDSLKEIKKAWAEVDGKSQHVHEFEDMHDVGDAMMSALLADPVIDREEIVVEYQSVEQLLADLRGVGVGNTHQSRAAGLTGPKRWREFIQAIESQRENGVIPLTYEIVYGLAWGTGVSPITHGRVE